MFHGGGALLITQAAPSSLTALFLSSSVTRPVESDGEMAFLWNFRCVDTAGI
jgi:hypothetical protein